jgi:hypothetical protein
MRWRHFSCALIFFFSSIGLSHADVTFSYVAGNPGETLPVYNSTFQTFTTVGGTTSTTGGTSNWTAPTGTQLSIPIYFLETVTQTATTTNAQTSIINQYWNGQYGVASVGFGLSQTGATGIKSQIGNASEVIWTPPSTAAGNQDSAHNALPGVANTTGFTFGQQFAGPNSFSYRGPGSTTSSAAGPILTAFGGSDLSVIYQNLNQANGMNGNNLQVVASFSQNGENGNPNNVHQGALTNGQNLMNGSTKYVGTGVVLIGTVNITVGTGTTTFTLSPLASSKLTAPTDPLFNPTFDGYQLATTNQLVNSTHPNGLTNISASSGYTVGQFSGLDTPISNSATQSLFGNVAFGQISPDVSLTTSPAGKSINVWTSLDNSNNGDAPISGPDHPGGATLSTIGAYTASPSSFTITVGPAAVPEPSSMALCGLLTLAGGWYAAKRRKAAVTV